MSDFFISQSYTNFDKYVDAVKTWDLEFTQFSPGKFRADLLKFGDEDLAIAKVQYNKLLLQNGSAPANGYTFAIHHYDSAPFLWRYLDFTFESIIVFPENKELHGVSKPGHHPITVTISENFTSTVAHELGLPEPEKFIPQGEVCACDPTEINLIKTMLVSMCRIMKYTAGRISDPLMRDETKWELTRILLLALAKSKSIKPKRRQFSKRREIVDRVLEYVNVELPTPKSISELCHVAEVDDRTLRNIFYELFFLSPKKFLTCYRLNAVRTELIRLDPTQIYVADIANKYGFWHMGQFAADYRRLFGELPSETLIRQGGKS